jgi:hypothetical protein
VLLFITDVSMLMHICKTNPTREENRIEQNRTEQSAELPDSTNRNKLDQK